jgi:Chaperone of endosialidase
MAFNEQHQNPGNPIPSASWNNIIDEIKRLGTAKVDVTGGTVSGALSVQQTLTVTGSAAVGGATVNGTMSVAGQASLSSGASVNGSLNVTGTASVNGNTSVSGLRVGGGGAPADTAEVAGNLRLGTMPGGNPLRFTSVWSGFPDSTTNQAEICNSIEPQYTSLMIVGNKSRANQPNRIVGVWDRLEVHGQSCATSFCNLSDGRLKTDVATITDPLERLGRLRGVSFRWREAPAEAGGTSMASPLPSPQQDPGYGVVAQEVEEVFPSLVSPMGAQQHLGVDYGGLTAVLIEAVKQLRAENEELRARVTALEESARG